MAITARSDWPAGRRKRSRDEGYLVNSFSDFLAAGGFWKCWVTEKDNNRSVEAR
jgi:hypothetical protein